MKHFKIVAVFLLLAMFAVSCSQNHYSKAKRKMTHNPTALAPVADLRP